MISSTNITSVDIYSMTNPAMCAVILWAFTDGYHQADSNGCSIPLIYVPLPVILSKSLDDSFEGTNSRTGLLEWPTRNPNLPIGLGSMIAESKNITVPALRFALAHDLITLNQSGCLVASRTKLPNQSLLSSNTTLNHFKKRANTLGFWFGRVGSPSLIMQSLGIRP